MLRIVIAMILVIAASCASAQQAAGPNDQIKFLANALQVMQSMRDSCLNGSVNDQARRMMLEEQTAAMKTALDAKDAQIKSLQDELAQAKQKPKLRHPKPATPSERVP